MSVAGLAAAAAEGAERSERERRSHPRSWTCSARPTCSASACRARLEGQRPRRRAGGDRGGARPGGRQRGLVPRRDGHERAGGRLRRGGRRARGVRHTGRGLGGAFAPRGTATGSGDRLEVTGRWAFASGSDFCDWLIGGCLTELDGRPVEPRLVLFPRADVEILDTWHVSGLRGTGSNDIAVDGLEVPGGPLERPCRRHPARGGRPLRVSAVRPAGRPRSRA